ncbi:MAG TPA: hypothetical protein VGI97_08385 [Gemmatimonadaceae bacterium]|jgi:hypothetical protein
MADMTAGDAITRAVCEERASVVRWILHVVEENMPLGMAAPYLGKDHDTLCTRIRALRASLHPTWTCTAQRSHGICNATNSADETRCGACDAERPIPEPPRSTTPGEQP